MKKILIVLATLILALSANAQTTSVTATISTPDGFAFANGSVLAQFYPPGGTINQNLYKLNGSAFPYSVSGSMDGTGTFTIVLTDDHKILPAGGLWRFTLCSNASVPCTNSLQDVFGTSINLSSPLSAAVTTPSVNPANLPKAFADTEVNVSSVGNALYYNLISGVARIWNGSSWSTLGTAGSSVGNSTDTEVLFNATNQLTGSADFTWNYGSNILGIGLNSGIGQLQLTGTPFANGPWAPNFPNATYPCGGANNSSVIVGSIGLPAICSSSLAGGQALTFHPSTSGVNKITVGQSSVVIANTLTTGSNVIVVTFDSTLSTALSVTCNTSSAQENLPLFISSRTSGTSFTVSQSANVATNPVCFSWYMVTQ